MGEGPRSGGQGENVARISTLVDPSIVVTLRDMATREGQTVDMANLATLPAELRSPMPNGRAYYRLVQAVYDRDQGMCWLCGGPVPRGERSLDHRLPRALGGGNDLPNLALAHRRPQPDTGCPGNYGRGARPPRRRGGGGGAVGTSREW